MLSDLVWLGVAAAFALIGVVLVAFGARVLIHEAQGAAWRRSLVAFELRLPRTATVAEVGRWVGTVRAMTPARRWWSILPRWPLVVETSATRAGVRRVLLVPARLQTEVVATVGALVPGARLDELPDYLAGQRRRYQAAGEARLRGFGDLLAVGRAGDASRHVLAALQPLEDGEEVQVQWVITGARAPRWITSPRTERADLPELWKAGDPMLSASCRVAVSSRFGRARALSVCRRVWASLRAMNTPRARMGRRWWIPRLAVVGRLHARVMPRGRWPIVATSAELAGLLGFATGEMTLPGVAGGVSRTLPTPPSMPAKGLVVARSNYPGMTDHDIVMSILDRLRHLWVAGPTGTGKTTLLAAMALHDIKAGHGAAVVDAGGALIERIQDRIPEHRLDDVIVMDPSSGDHIVGLNPLRAGEPEQAASFVYHVLHSIYVKSWGPRTADIMRAGLLTLAHTKAANGQPFTLAEMPELLTNATFRRTVTRQSLSPHIGSFWRWYESLSEPARLNAIGPVLNKLRAFTLSTPLRLMLGQSTGINMADVMTGNKILLVPLKTGFLGAENAALIGSLITSAVWQATLARVAIPEDKRRPFWMYLDEFQHIVRLPIDIGDMLEQARGLKLGLTLAHQFLRQLDPALQASVLDNVRTHVLFQLGVQDSTRLAESFTPLTADDLRHLGPYEVAIRPYVNGSTLTPVTGRTYPLPEPMRDGHELAAESRQRFGIARDEVEAATLERLAVPAGKRSNELTFGGES
jgi:hypothetical protein